MEYREKKLETRGERKVLKSGKAWMRWLMVPVAFFSVLHIFEHLTSLTGYIVLFIAVGLFYVLKRARRLEHDELNLYIIRDKKETIVPFTSIISIKRSGMKVNGSRPWKIRYEDHIRKQRTIWFFNDFFNKKFHNAVRAANPKVVIWTHHYFAHAEDNKHNPDYKN